MMTSIYGGNPEHRKIGRRDEGADDIDCFTSEVNRFVTRLQPGSVRSFVQPGTGLAVAETRQNRQSCDPKRSRDLRNRPLQSLLKVQWAGVTCAIHASLTEFSQAY